MEKKYEERAGDRQAASVEVQNKYDGKTKEARRECNEKLHSSTMQSGGHPDDFFYT